VGDALWAVHGQDQGSIAPCCSWQVEKDTHKPEENQLGTVGKAPFGLVSCAQALAPWTGSKGSWAPLGTHPVPGQQAQPLAEMDLL